LHWRAVAGLAKFAGSGGDIIGMCETQFEYRELQQVFHRLGVRMLAPTLTRPRLAVKPDRGGRPICHSTAPRCLCIQHTVVPFD
jgi:hypothetical protein